MELIIDSLTESDVIAIKNERNQYLHGLRTPYLLTDNMQIDFYNNVVCDRNARSRYFAIRKYNDVYESYVLVGMAGIENIEWENSRGEISLILLSKHIGKGLGQESLKLLLDFGFNSLNLKNIWGECYFCNPSINFWKREINKRNAYYTTLLNMKFWDGRYWNALWFNFTKSEA